jgi:hypothetical protein
MKLNRRYQYTAPEGTISLTGIDLINKLIRIQRLDLPEWETLNPVPRKVNYVPALPETWPWLWMVSSGDYRGTFAKRVAQFWHKGYGLKAPKSVVEQIGNLARQHSGEAVSYEFDFVNEFEWTPGTFGENRNSCWWGSHSEARVMLRDNGGLAMRFFHAGTDEGYARAWLVPTKRFHVLFNGYGFGNPTLTIARIFAGFRGEVYQQINLYNNGSSDSTVYINSGIGFVIGTAENIEGIYTYDFEWWEEDTTECYDCGRRLHDDHVHYGANDLPYCLRCHERLFTECYICNRTRWAEDVTYIDDEPICERCRENHYSVCDGCGEDVYNRDIRERNGMPYCQTCSDELPVQKKK